LTDAALTSASWLGLERLAMLNLTVDAPEQVIGGDMLSRQKS
jgi:hypothetical protein